MIPSTYGDGGDQGSDRFPGANRFPIRFQSVPAKRFRPYYVVLGTDTGTREQDRIASQVRRSLTAAPAPEATGRAVPAGSPIPDPERAVSLPAGRRRNRNRNRGGVA